MGGYSAVIDPVGDAVAEAGSAAAVLSVDIDPAQVTQWRSTFPVLGDRRL